MLNMHCQKNNKPMIKDKCGSYNKKSNFILVAELGMKVSF